MNLGTIIGRLRRQLPIRQYREEVCALLTQLSDEDIHHVNLLIFQPQRWRWMSRPALVDALRPLWPCDEHTFISCVEHVRNPIEVMALGISSKEVNQPISVSALISSLHPPDRASRNERVRQLWTSSAPDDRIILGGILTGTLQLHKIQHRWVEALSTYYDVSVMAASRYAQMHVDKAWSTKALMAAASLTQPHELRSITVGPDQLIDQVDDVSMSVRWPGVWMHATKYNGEVNIWTDDGHWITSRFERLSTALQQLPDRSHILLQTIYIIEGIIQDTKSIHQRIIQPRSGKARAERQSLTYVLHDVLFWDGMDQSDQSREERTWLLEDFLHGLAPPHPLTMTPWLSSSDLVPGVSIDELLTEYQGHGLVAWSAKDPFVYYPVVYGRRYLIGMLRYVRREINDPAGGSMTYTIAIRDRDDYAPIYTGSWDMDLDTGRLVKSFIQAHVEERFGPVRQVAIGLPVRISYSTTKISKRSKAGIQLVDAKIEGLAGEGEEETLLSEIT